jgi:hypothetical protein
LVAGLVGGGGADPRLRLMRLRRQVTASGVTRVRAAQVRGRAQPPEILKPVDGTPPRRRPPGSYRRHVDYIDFRELLAAQVRALGENCVCVCVGHVRDAPSQLAPMQAAWRAAHDMGVRAPPTVVDLPEETEAANVNSAFARALRPRNLELEVGPPMMFARSVSCLRDAAAAAATR